MIEEQDGTKDTNWSHKVTELETSPMYISDDGENWEKDGESKYQYTSYTYDTWEKLHADEVMPNIFSEKTFEGFALDDTKIIYKEGYQDAKEEMTEQYLDASYTNGKKKIEANLRVEKVTQETEEEIENVLEHIDATVLLEEVEK